MSRIVMVAACLLPGGLHAQPDRPVFTHGPTDTVNTAGVRPLGNLNPGGGHVLAVDHMYVDYPFPNTGGAFAYPVYAMGEGELVTVFRQQIEGRADFDYQIFIRHSRAVTSYFDHLHALSSRIMAHIDSAPEESWILVPGSASRLLFLGERGAPEPLALLGGEQVGITKSYSFSWDIGLIDTHVHQYFAGHKQRYPDFEEFLKLLGYKVRVPFAGNKTMNAACFIDYLAPALRAAWLELLISTPKGCGSDAWDVNGGLRGAWFNPAIDKAPPLELFNLESAALAVIPYNLAPTTKVQIGVGSGTPYAALDPAGAYPQLRNPLVIDINATPGARLNPDPATVEQASGTVCYDIAYNDGGMTRYNALLFRLLGPHSLAIKYDPAPRDFAPCVPLGFPEPDDTWVTYVR